MAGISAAGLARGQLSCDSDTVGDAETLHALQGQVRTDGAGCVTGTGRLQEHVQVEGFFAWLHTDGHSQGHCSGVIICLTRS